MNTIVLQTEKLCKRFGRLKVVNELNLEVHQGDIYGFLGLNGAGKTTTIRMLLRLIKPNAGRIWLYEKELKRHYLKIMQSVGALVEIPVFYSYLSGRQNLKILAGMSFRPNGNKHINEVLDWVGLTSRADDKVRAYSQGMRQRLGIAQALLVTSYKLQVTSNGSPLIILDEPTNGLDPQGIADIRNLIKRLNQKQGITFFISSHLLSEIELLCNRVGIIKQGNLVVQGEVDKLLQEVSMLRLKVAPLDKAIPLIKGLSWCSEVESRPTLSGEEIIVRCPIDKASDLNKYLVQHNIQVAQIAPHGRSLEEYFISLM